MGTPDEQDAIQSVIDGTPTGNAARYVAGSSRATEALGRFLRVSAGRCSVASISARWVWLRASDYRGGIGAKKLSDALTASRVGQLSATIAAGGKAPMTFNPAPGTWWVRINALARAVAAKTARPSNRPSRTGQHGNSPTIARMRVGGPGAAKVRAGYVKKNPMTTETTSPMPPHVEEAVATTAGLHAAHIGRPGRCKRPYRSQPAGSRLCASFARGRSWGFCVALILRVPCGSRHRGLKSALPMVAPHSLRPGAHG